MTAAKRVASAPLMVQNARWTWANLGSMRFSLDPFTLALLAVVGLAALVPVAGNTADALGFVADIGIGLVFFLHGARLRPGIVIAGIRNWRLQTLILAATFLVYPIIGWLVAGLLPASVAAPLVTGILFLALLPSTVQSSVTLTSIAGGNVAGAVCAATASNLLGMFLVPVAAGLILNQEVGGLQLSNASPILFQLLLPFLAGQLLQPWIGDRARRTKALSVLERGAIVLVVYLAFSASIVADLWTRVSLSSLAWIIAACLVMLGAAAMLVLLAARAWGFDRSDQATSVLCGSFKSLVSGIPIANVLFAGSDLGLIVLPLMLFHQFQLIAGAVFAKRWSRGSARGAPG